MAAETITTSASETNENGRVLDGLRAAVRGDVVGPADAAYDSERALWNGMIDRRPAAIVAVASAEDVAAVIRFAAGNGLVVTARGGGHGVAGSALTDGGLVVDLSRLTGIEVDPERRVARAGAGCRLGDLDAATQEHGLAAPLGVVSQTGIAGLTLSGGIGWLRRKHGLSADNLVSLEVATAVILRSSFVWTCSAASPDAKTPSCAFACSALTPGWSRAFRNSQRIPRLSRRLVPVGEGTESWIPAGSTSSTLAIGTQHSAASIGSIPV